MHTKIGNAILKTLKCKELDFEIMSIQDIKDYLLLDDPVYISETDFNQSINNLLLQNKIYEYQGFISTDKQILENKVEAIQQELKKTRKLISKIQSVSKIYDDYDKIQAVCIDTLTLKKYNKTNLIVIHNEIVPRQADWKFKIYTKIKRIPNYKLIKINENSLNKFVEILINESASLNAKPTYNIKLAYQILMIKPLHNKGGYERLMHQNMWIFDYFKNYPMKKISLGYKV